MYLGSLLSVGWRRCTVAKPGRFITCVALLGMLIMGARADGPQGGSKTAQVGAGAQEGGGDPALFAPAPGLDAKTILQRAAARYPDLHRGAIASMLRGPLLLSYVREIRAPQPLVVSHLLYAWPPERARLELRVLEGAGKDSISLLDDAAAWLLVDGQRVEVNRRELQSKTRGYGLQSLLKVHLELPDQVATMFGAEGTTYEGRVLDEGGRTLHVIGLSAGDNRPRIVRVAVEEGTWWVRRVSYRSTSGASEFSYSDFRVALPSLSLPYRIELMRNGRREDVVQIRRIEVLALAHEGLLDPSRVRPPARRGMYNATDPQN